jgi:hypothetical protein
MINFPAILLVLLGLTLIVVGWNGTYTTTWDFLIGKAPGQSPPSSQSPGVPLPGPGPNPTYGIGIPHGSFG